MGRFCYCSKILPGKTETVRQHWKNKRSAKKLYTEEAEQLFWDHLSMTGFESWLQPTPQGDYMIHCLEGESLQKIFKGLREEIAANNPIALNLRNFYLEVLGKDYALPNAEPHLEHLLDISLPTNSPIIHKRAFFSPLLPHQEEAHRRFREESMTDKRSRHEESLEAFGLSHLSGWIQSTHGQKYIINYSEGPIKLPATPEERLRLGEKCPAWKEISTILMTHTGLKPHELSPQVEWLTVPTQEV